MRTSNFVEGSRPEDLFFLTAPLDSAHQPIGHFVSQQAAFRFVVRVSINGHRWTLFGIQDFDTACRFADMFVLRFRKYLRPDTIKWNFSEQQAVADTADTSERGGDLANFFLARAERELKASGHLIEQTEQTVVVKPTRINRLDVLEQCNANLEQRIAELSQLVGALEQQIEQINSRLGDIQ